MVIEIKISCTEAPNITKKKVYALEIENLD